MAMIEEILVPRSELLDALDGAETVEGNVVPLHLAVGVMQDHESLDLMLLFRDQQMTLPAIGRWTRGGTWVDGRALKRALLPRTSDYASLRRIGTGLYVDDQRVR